MTAVVVYSTISGTSQFRPLRKTAKEQIGALLRRTADQARWRLRGDFSMNFYVWQRFENTNRGDIAIRETIGAQVAALALPTPCDLVEVQWGQLTESHVQRLNEAGGIFVLAGGGYLFLDGDGSISPRIEADIALMRRMSCLRVGYGIGINQVRVGSNLSPVTAEDLPQATHETLRRFAATVDLISVRDRSSKNVLDAVIGGGMPQVHLIGDPVLFLNPGPPPHRPPPQQGMLLGLNFALHGRNTAATLPERMLWIVPFLRRMRASWNCRFRYFVHSDTEHVLVHLLRRAGFQMEVIDGDTATLMRGYAELDAHVCQMMHSSIMAISAWVPTLNIGYDVKNREFFSLLGIDGCCIDQAEANEDLLFERTATLLADTAGFVETVARNRQALQRNLSAFQSEILARAGAARVASEA